MEIKRIDFTKGSFPAKGKDYLFSQALSIERYEQFEKLEVLLGYNLGYDALYGQLTELYNELNKSQFVKSAVITYNLLDATKRKVDNKIHPALQMCALFCNTVEEDATKFDAKLMDAKIKDWREEGYAMTDFFSLAANLVKGFVKNYTADLKDSLNKLQEENAKQ
jgi:hypothetical protein